MQGLGEDEIDGWMHSSETTLHLAEERLQLWTTHNRGWAEKGPQDPSAPTTAQAGPPRVGCPGPLIERELSGDGALRKKMCRESNAEQIGGTYFSGYCI